MGRLPKKDDFPPNIHFDIVPPPQSDPPTNILLLLHGLGDSHTSFTSLARQLCLPETACVSLCGPSPLLDLGGFHWGDDLLFDSSSSSAGLDPDAGFTTSTQLLTTIVQGVLVEKCAFTPRQILLFGFGQGGMSALSFAVSCAAAASLELGGVVSVGGPLADGAPSSREAACKTPVLVCAGSDQSAVTSTSEAKLKRVFDAVEVKRYRKPGDSMPANRDEMMPIMRFFARRLRSTKGVPEGSVEMGVGV